MKITQPTRDPRVDKLPKWAQEYIASLERTTLFAMRNAADLQDAQEPTSVTYGDHYDNPRYLQDGTTVRFHLADGEWIDVRAAIPEGRGASSHLDRDEQIVVTGSNQLRIAPGVSNVIGVSNYRR